jgi:hypothetical protein
VTVINKLEKDKKYLVYLSNYNCKEQRKPLSREVWWQTLKINGDLRTKKTKFKWKVAHETKLKWAEFGESQQNFSREERDSSLSFDWSWFLLKTSFCN